MDWITGGLIIKVFQFFSIENKCYSKLSAGVELTRRFLLDWLTFLCRYIPIGLLEHPPQKLNDRCPRFVGRDDLETLMGSFDPADWLKIRLVFLIFWFLF